MENFIQNKWAPFPEDNVTSQEFDASVQKLISLGKLDIIKGLHSNSFTQRVDALYDFIVPMHSVTRSLGKPVELGMYLPEGGKQVGRAAAGFFCSAECNFNVEELNITFVSIVATIDAITIGLSNGTKPVSDIILNITLPESERNSLVMIGKKALGLDRCIYSTPGSVIDPEALGMLESILICTAGVLGKSAQD